MIGMWGDAASVALDRQCPSCHAWYTGTFHTCSSTTWWNDPVQIRIAAALERIAAALEAK